MCSGRGRGRAFRESFRWVGHLLGVECPRIRSLQFGAMRATPIVALAFLAALSAFAACGGSDVSSTADAQKAYLGLDPSIDKAITLGFVGYNAATSANIDDHSMDGGVSGTLTVGGQVDQGTSSNKTMRLVETL